MTYRIISTWSSPHEDLIDEFEEYYNTVHAPFAARVPGCIRLITQRTSDPFEADPSSFYRVAELWFESRESLIEATKSTEWAEMRNDGRYVHARFGAVLETGLGDIVDWHLDPGGPKPVSGGENA
jgi:uncharacterized protein (TIGR02118 family)